MSALNGPPRRFGEALQVLHRLVLGLCLFGTLAAPLGGCGTAGRTRAAAPPPLPSAGPDAAASVYLGWRVFQDRCAFCHGLAAEGGPHGPNLLARVIELGPRRFATQVLMRYDWDETAGRARDDAQAREALVDDVLQRRTRLLEMPAWQGEPRVQAHIQDLYEYLAARAAGTQGTGAPPR